VGVTSDVTSNAVTAIVLVQPPTPTPGDEGGQGEDFAKSSPVGFVVLLMFFIAVIFLVRSMNKHLRRVPQSFEPQSFEPPAQPAAGEKAPEDKNTDTR
jgi:hypothetical protein